MKESKKLTESVFSDRFQDFLSKGWNRPIEKNFVSLVLKDKTQIIENGEQGKEYLKDLYEKNKNTLIDGCTDEFINELERLSNEYIAESKRKKINEYLNYKGIKVGEKFKCSPDVQFPIPGKNSNYISKPGNEFIVRKVVNNPHVQEPYLMGEIDGIHQKVVCLVKNIKNAFEMSTVKEAKKVDKEKDNTKIKSEKKPNLKLKVDVWDFDAETPDEKDKEKNYLAKKGATLKWDDVQKAYKSGDKVIRPGLLHPSMYDIVGVTEKLSDKPLKENVYNANQKQQEVLKQTKPQDSTEYFNKSTKKNWNPENMQENAFDDNKVNQEKELEKTPKSNGGLKEGHDLEVEDISLRIFLLKGKLLLPEQLQQIKSILSKTYGVKARTDNNLKVDKIVVEKFPLSQLINLRTDLKEISQYLEVEPITIPGISHNLANRRKKKEVEEGANLDMVKYGKRRFTEIDEEESLTEIENIIDEAMNDTVNIHTDNPEIVDSWKDIVNKTPTSHTIIEAASDGEFKLKKGETYKYKTPSGRISFLKYLGKLPKDHNYCRIVLGNDGVSTTSQIHIIMQAIRAAEMPSENVDKQKGSNWKNTPDGWKLVREAGEKKFDKRVILFDLYNAILNDYSIQRFTLNWKDIVDTIKRVYKNIPEQKNITFENSLLTKAIQVTNGSKLCQLLQTFARELDINLETARSKPLRRNEAQYTGQKKVAKDIDKAVKKEEGKDNSKKKAQDKTNYYAKFHKKNEENKNKEEKLEEDPKPGKQLGNTKAEIVDPWDDIFNITPGSHTIKESDVEKIIGYADETVNIHKEKPKEVDPWAEYGIKSEWLEETVGNPTVTDLQHNFLDEDIDQEEQADPRIRSFLDKVRIADNNIQFSDISVEATPKGNWEIFVDGKHLMVIQGKYLDDAIIEKYGLEHHHMDSEFEPYANEEQQVYTETKLNENIPPHKLKLKLSNGNIVNLKQPITHKNYENLSPSDYARIAAYHMKLAKWYKENPGKAGFRLDTTPYNAKALMKYHLDQAKAHTLKSKLDEGVETTKYKNKEIKAKVAGEKEGIDDKVKEQEDKDESLEKTNMCFDSKQAWEDKLKELYKKVTFEDELYAICAYADDDEVGEWKDDTQSGGTGKIWYSDQFDSLEDIEQNKTLKEWRTYSENGVTPSESIEDDYQLPSPWEKKTTKKEAYDITGITEGSYVDEQGMYDDDDDDDVLTDANMQVGESIHGYGEIRGVQPQSRHAILVFFNGENEPVKFSKDGWGNWIDDTKSLHEEVTTANMAVPDQPVGRMQTRKQDKPEDLEEIDRFFMEFVIKNCDIKKHIREGKFYFNEYMDSRPYSFQKQLYLEFQKSLETEMYQDEIPVTERRQLDTKEDVEEAYRDIYNEVESEISNESNFTSTLKDEYDDPYEQEAIKRFMTIYGSYPWDMLKKVDAVPIEDESFYNDYHDSNPPIQESEELTPEVGNEKEIHDHLRLEEEVEDLDTRYKIFDNLKKQYWYTKEPSTLKDAIKLRKQISDDNYPVLSGDKYHSMLQIHMFKNGKFIKNCSTGNQKLDESDSAFINFKQASAYVKSAVGKAELVHGGVDAELVSKYIDRAATLYDLTPNEVKNLRVDIFDWRNKRG